MLISQSHNKIWANYGGFPWIYHLPELSLNISPFLSHASLILKIGCLWQFKHIHQIMCKIPSNTEHPAVKMLCNTDLQSSRTMIFIYIVWVSCQVWQTKEERILSIFLSILVDPSSSYQIFIYMNAYSVFHLGRIDTAWFCSIEMHG